MYACMLSPEGLAVVLQRLSNGSEAQRAVHMLLVILPLLWVQNVSNSVLQPRHCLHKGAIMEVVRV